MSQAPPPRDPAPQPAPRATAPAPRAPRRSVIGTAHRGISSLMLLALLGGVSYMGYKLMRNHVAAKVYEERLVELNAEYGDLARDYNQAVTRTAVTELEVHDNEVCVTVRTADGQIDRQVVDVDPANDIYVDYVVKDGRLLIRRVFDSTRAPDDAGAVDSDLLNIDWNDPSVSHGQAIYRKLTTGRWIVAVSGSGALTLAKVNPTDEVQLMKAPKVSEFSPVEATTQEIEKIGPTDVLGRFFGSQ